jgi:hypothetical protein
MRRRFPSLVMICTVLTLGSMLGGCRWLRAWSDYDSPGYAASNLSVENGHQSGAMGEVAGYEGAAFQHEGYAYDGYAHIRIDSQGRGWWVMTAIDISGVDLEALEPGVVYATPTAGVIEEGHPQVDVLGCSGPTVGNWTYDRHAERTEIQVQDLSNGARRVSFRAWFTSYDGSAEQLAEGSFDVRRRLD